MKVVLRALGVGLALLKGFYQAVMRLVLHIMFSALSFALCLWLGITLLLSLYSLPAPPVPEADTIVILGAGYYKDGHPVPALEARLKTGIELWNEIEPKPTLLVSGTKEEAQVMEQYLMGARIPRRAILQDTQGTNTAATVRAMRGSKRRCVFVSQAYHLPRVRLYAAAYGVDAAFYPSAPVPIGFFRLFPLAARESLAVLVFPLQYLFFNGYK